MCHVCMLLSLRVLYMYCRTPCRALSMNLEPSTTESNYLHTLLRTTCLCARPHLRMRISSYKINDDVCRFHPVLYAIRDTSQNKPHNNGRLAALFPEVTHEDFFRSELEYTVGFDREEIQLSSISPWEKFVAYR